MTPMLLLAASDGSPVSFQILPFVTTLIVFTIAFFVLATKVWPKILGGLEDRDRKIRDEIAAAEDARRKAESAMREYEQSLATARQEAADMIAKARSDARAVADELRARNETDLAEMRQRATRDIDSAKYAALSEIHAEAAVLGAAIASRILEREINADDQRRLVEESLKELRTVGTR